MGGKKCGYICVKSRLSSTHLSLGCLAAVKTVAGLRMTSRANLQSYRGVCIATQSHTHALICAARSKQVKLSQIKQRMMERQQNTPIMKELAGRERTSGRLAFPLKDRQTPMCPSSSSSVRPAQDASHATDADFTARHPHLRKLTNMNRKYLQLKLAGDM